MNSFFECNNFLVLREIESFYKWSGVAVLFYFLAKLLKLIGGKSLYKDSIHI